MPEGMPNPEFQNRNNPPNPKETKPPTAEKGFLACQSRIKEINSKDQITLTQGEQEERQLLEKRRDQLIQKVESSDEWTKLELESEVLDAVARGGSEADYLKAKRESRLGVINSDRLAYLDNDDPRRGVRQWLLDNRIVAKADRIYTERLMAEAGAEDRKKTAEQESEEQRRTAQRDEVKEDLSNFPPAAEVDKQREYVRQLLDKIENSHSDCESFSLYIVVRNIETSYGRMAPEIQSEVKTRIALHECSRLIIQANGNITAPKDKPVSTIGDMANEARRRGRELSSWMIRMLLEDKISGLKTAEAWDCLQKVNVDLRRSGDVDHPDERGIWTYERYIEEANREKLTTRLLTKGVAVPQVEEVFNFLRDINFDHKRGLEHMPDSVRNYLQARGVEEDDIKDLYRTNDFEVRDDEAALGKVRPTYLTDSNGSRRRAVYELLLQEVMATGIDRTSAEKSFQLAEKLTTASLENSVFNRRALAGNDDLAEMIDFLAWRLGRREPGRGRGPEFTEKAIKSIGGSYFRTLGEEGAPDNDHLLLAKDIKMGIKEGTWVAYCTVTLSRYSAVREAVMKTDWEPGDITVHYLRDKLVAAFNTVDGYHLSKERKAEIRTSSGDPKIADKRIKDEEREHKLGPMKLRAVWLAGVVSEALAERDTVWDRNAIMALEKAVSIDKLSPEAGTFISKNTWGQIKQQCNIDNILLRYAINRGLSESLTGFKPKPGRKKR